MQIKTRVKANVRLKKVAMLVVVVMFFASFVGCATMDNQARKTGAGAAIGTVGGAALGAVIGGAIGGGRGAGIGALIGGGTGLIAGTVTGSILDQQAQEFKQAGLQAERIEDGRLLLRLTESHLKFDFDSSDIKPEYVGTLNRIAEILKKYPENRVRIVGYTDNIGNAYYNIVLSKKRAASVAGFLYSKGMNAMQVKKVEGYGEDNPIATNETPFGRSLNRRVELFIETQ